MKRKKIPLIRAGGSCPWASCKLYRRAILTFCQTGDEVKPLSTNEVKPLSEVELTYTTPLSYPWQSIYKNRREGDLLLFLRRSFTTKRTAKVMKIYQKIKMILFLHSTIAHNCLIRCNFFG